MAKPATIDEYIGALPEPLADVAGRTRRVIDAEPAVGESAIEWAAGVEHRQEAGRVSEGGIAHVTFGFRHGALMDDPSGRLESSGKVMAPVELRRPEDVDRTLFVSWPKRALAIELAGA
jgi:hypothetical protein